MLNNISPLEKECGEDFRVHNDLNECYGISIFKRNFIHVLFYISTF